MREYIDRFYRRFMKTADLVTFTVQIKESDLMMNAQSDLSQLTYSILDRERKNLESYIRYDPNFKSSLVPVKVADFAPPICKIMAKAAHKANVGPMAAVAGAINDRLAGDLLRQLKFAFGFLYSSPEKVLGRISLIFFSRLSKRCDKTFPSPTGIFKTRGRSGLAKLKM